MTRLGAPAAPQASTSRGEAITFAVTGAGLSTPEPKTRREDP
ncbi:MAG: hypothetical protein SFW67_09555 [Myxococcaceae bacterium]|nr:hypothetical protein [Myxococcaceae bacterium]